MKSCIKFVFAGLVILAGTIFAADANQLYPANLEKGQQERKMHRDLCKTVISWLSDGKASEGIECDKLADSLLSLEEPSVKSYLIAAQVANLREKPKKAISILEGLISKHPDENAVVMNFPVRIVGRFWIATIAKQSADITKAHNAYKAILEELKNLEDLRGKEGLTMICNLYLAEIESKCLKRKDLALARLEAIKKIEKPAGHWGEQYEVYKHWAIYEHARISKGKDQAARKLITYPEFTISPLVAATQAKLCGISSKLFPDYPPSDKRSDVIGKALLDRVINSTVSSIDRSLVRLIYAIVHQQRSQLAEAKKNYPEAEKEYTEAAKYYLALFEEDSFFSPLAGLCLAQVKRAQDKTAEADSILEQVKVKYPGYDSVVAKLKESWNKRTPENK